MALRSHRGIHRPIRGAELAFDAIAIEGGLLAADWLARVAQLRAPHQDPSDYGVLKGLELRDEIGRYWRIAQAHWSDFAAGLKAGAEPEALTRRFMPALLRDAFGFTDLAERPPRSAGIMFDGPEDGGREPVMLGGLAWPLTAIDPAGRVPLVCAPAGSGLDTPHPHLGDGHRKRSAFGLVQEFLNTADQALWGLCTDGLRLRLVRDNASLTRPAWVELDLARVFTEGLYPDFAAAWLLLHRSRFGRADQDADTCPLEAWRSAAREEGTLARARLRGGFEDALLTLGQGFLAHPSNQALRQALHGGALNRHDYFGQLLRLVYRFIFLLTVEERGLLHPKDTPPDIQERYTCGYSLQRLRDRAARRAAHDRHDDLWEALKIAFRGLVDGEPGLGLPALAGLFAPGQCPHLDAAHLDNRALLGALFRLCWLRESAGITRVNWRDMGPDELGYVYEGLLELIPQIAQDGRSFRFAGRDESRGNARKTSGSYYTPDSLVEILLDSALNPVMDATVTRHPDQPVEALLSLAVVDPACGSGHFLLAAARRLAERVARLKAQGTPTPEDYRHALRQVVGRCIYGVDLNPLAVELCKVALWMEAVDPGLPLTFLDSHIRHGNALLGTSHALMSDGIPDEAWVVLEGDTAKLTKALKSKNKAERGGQLQLSLGAPTVRGGLRAAVDQVEATPDTDAVSLAQKEARWAELLASEPWRHETLVHDAWCAAFLWPKGEAGPVVEAAPTEAVWRALADGNRPSPVLETTADRLARDYALFHWALAFPQVFERGGFDVVLGNPPWEHLEQKEEEFFAVRSPEIANATNASERKRLIAALPAVDTDLWSQWQTAKRLAQGEIHLTRMSSRFPLCARGRINTYPLFAEHNLRILGPQGRAGFIVPTGIATDDTTKDYFGALVAGRHLARLYSFENEALLFRDVHHAFRFALLTIDGAGETYHADLIFFARYPSDLDDADRRFALSAADFALLCPNTRTCPTFRTARDARLNLALYRCAGVLWREGDPDGNPWGLRLMQGIFNMSSDSGLFRTCGELTQAAWILEGNRFIKDGQIMLPLYEAKMIHRYDHRFGSYEAQTDAQSNQGKLPELTDDDHADPHRTTLPRYWVEQAEVDDRLAGRWDRQWLLGWRDVCRSTDSRTLIASLVPYAAVGHKLPLALVDAPAPTVACFLANLSSFVLDYAARQKVGGISLAYFLLKQFPMLNPMVYSRQAHWMVDQTVRDWLLPRILELTYTAWDLQPFARDCGDEGPPFIWDPDRRFRLQCELDAAFFHLYAVSRDDADYILGTFDVLERADIRNHGEYRTRRVVLECYDALAQAATTGRPYCSPLGPPRRAASP